MSTTTPLPHAVIRALKQETGYKRKRNEDVLALEFQMGSPAYAVWKNAAVVGNAYFLSMPFYGITKLHAKTTDELIIKEEDYWPVNQAVNSVLLAYASCMEAPIAVPLLEQCTLPPRGVVFQQSPMLAFDALERIQSGEGLPAIATLPRHTIIVRMLILYDNCVVSILISKL
jgi:hypothetical protein